MKAMICKMEKGFEPVFFDVNTLDDLLNAIDEYNYPSMQINIEDDEHGNPRMGIELQVTTTEKRERYIKSIVDILKKYEEHLSDGYIYYNEFSDDVVNELLCEIAQNIIATLDSEHEINARHDDVHTIDADVSYAVCLNLNLPNPDNPELIVMSGKSLILALENLDWKEED